VPYAVWVPSERSNVSIGMGVRVEEGPNSGHDAIGLT
jgi:hypothetical protein